LLLPVRRPTSRRAREVRHPLHLRCQRFATQGVLAGEVRHPPVASAALKTSRARTLRPSGPRPSMTLDGKPHPNKINAFTRRHARRAPAVSERKPRGRRNPLTHLRPTCLRAETRPPLLVTLQLPFGGDVSPLLPMRSMAKKPTPAKTPPRASNRPRHPSTPPIGRLLGIGYGDQSTTLSPHQSAADRAAISPRIARPIGG
jgi:hypothetical protein